jgi:YVTN family beta-propeller protein
MVCQSPSASQRRSTSLLTPVSTGLPRFCRLLHRPQHGRDRQLRRGTRGRGATLFGVLLAGALTLSGTLSLGPLPASASRDDAEGSGTSDDALPSRSSTIAITSDDRRVVVVNRETNTVSVIEVRDKHGKDVAHKLAEVVVGLEPRNVALHPNDHEAYVTNALSGTVSVIALAGEHAFQVVDEIRVGTEPRGCAVTPNGKLLYVANHTEGTVSVIDTASRKVVDTLEVGGNPAAIAVTNDGDDSDTDERVFVTLFFAEPARDENVEGFDDGKRGVLRTFRVNDTGSIAKIVLSAIPDIGFTADRTAFCPQTNPNLHDPIFCPDVQAEPGSDVITRDPQGAFPNQLSSALIREGLLYVPNICAGPEPPVQFTVNVQGCVHVVDAPKRVERKDLHVNLNVEVAAEPPPADPTSSLAGLFSNDLVAVDADPAGEVFLIVSRGGNFVFLASPDDDGKLTLGKKVVRIQTGNLPNGVVVSHDGRRAYTNNEANISVTAIDLEDKKYLTLDIPSGEPPAPGTVQHNSLLGKLAFFTALGVPDNGFLDTPIRDIVPLNFRGKQSSNAWSSCGSCHPDGLSDGVTWLFAAGPRQTIPLDGMFAKDTNMNDQRILNWSAVRGSNHDFNNNSRAVQGGCGFASDDFSNPPDDCLRLGAATPANPNIYDHGVTQGGSDALDVQTLWEFIAVRALNQPQPSETAALERGREVFEKNCASCHGGPKWTKSQIFYRDNPAFDKDPAQGGEPLDPGVTNAGAQIVSFTCNEFTLKYLENVGTFDPNDPIELRGQGALSGQLALGGLGFNVPSLLSVRYHAPYLHHGEAQTLEDVFPLHALGAGGGTIASTLSSGEQEDLLVFLSALDGRTDPLRSDGDEFRDDIAGGGVVAPCPPGSAPASQARDALLQRLGGR